MDSYIIRVYRRDLKDPNVLTGIIEIVSRQEKQPFRSYDELWQIMAADNEEMQREDKKKKKD